MRLKGFALNVVKRNVNSGREGGKKNLKTGYLEPRDEIDREERSNYLCELHCQGDDKYVQSPERGGGVNN